MISGVEVLVAGAPLDPTLAGRITEVRVDHHAQLPDAFCVRISDPGLEQMDTSPFKLGAEVEIKFSSPDGGAMTSLIVGQVLAVEPEFSVGHMILAARGYDYSHALHRSSTAETYQNMTVGDIARKVAQRAGFQATVEDDGRRARLRAAEQRDRLGLPLAARAARRLRGRRREAQALLPQGRRASRQTVSLRWGEGLTASGRASPACSRSTRSSSAAGTRRPRQVMSRSPRARTARARSASSARRCAGARRRPRDRERPARVDARGGRRARPERARAARQRATSRPRARRAATRASAPARCIAIDGIGERFKRQLRALLDLARLPRARTATRRTSRSPGARRAASSTWRRRRARARSGPPSSSAS